MTERQIQILAAIIEQYAEIAAPVGSITLAKLFGVSSATIRSEMANRASLTPVHLGIIFYAAKIRKKALFSYLQ